jgi:hypothetical protein
MKGISVAVKVAIFGAAVLSACTPNTPVVSSHSPTPASPSAGAAPNASPSPALVKGPGVWIQGPAMLVARAAFTATLLPSGKVLLAGGETSPAANTATAELLDPVTNTVAAAAPMSVARSGHTATLLDSGKVLVAGGIAAPTGAALASSEIYDPVTNTWSAAAAMAAARTDHAAVRLKDGRVMVLGGSFGFQTNAGPLDDELYDPLTNTWTAFRDDNRPNGVTATLLDDGRVLVLGGWAVVGPRTGDFFDPTTGGMVFGRNLSPTNRDWATAARLPNGGVIVVGGQTNGSAGGALNTTDVMGGGDSWIVGPAMRVGHCHNTLTTLAKGVILVAGGRCGSSDSIAVAELYDPNMHTWQLAANLLQPIGSGSGLLLSDGRALVAGGQTAGGAIVTTTEIYTPS